MKIVVLAGGVSSEREVSLVSGTQVCRALRSRGHRAVLLDVSFGDAGRTGDAAFPEAYDVDAAAAYARRFDAEQRDRSASFFGPGVLELCRAADVVFLALHGENGENGKIQATFDLLGIPYTGSGYLGSALAMDKGLSKQLFWQNGIPTPRGFVLRKGETYRPEEYGMTVPCVVKPCSGGSSVGTVVVRTPEEYGKALACAFSYEDTVLVEEYVSGREFSVGVVDGEAYPVIEIRPLSGFYDYEKKYRKGETVETCPADLSPALTQRMQDCAVQVCEILRLECYARVDFLTDEAENLYCLEANTLPGMTPTSLLPQEALAKGTEFADLCERLIEVSVRS